MTAGITNTDIERRRDDNYTWQIVVKDETATVVDVTGNTFRLVVASEEEPSDDSTELIDLTGTIVSAAGGVVQFAPTSANMNQTPGEYFYEIQMTNGAGARRTIMFGKFNIDQDIAKGA